MGALAGLVHFRPPAPSLGALAPMTDRLAHRGPEAPERFRDHHAALAYRRRAVLHPQRAQPVVTDDLVVMLDGRLYEQEALAAALGEPGLLGAELVLAAWRRYGVEALERVHGDFALAVWDRRAHALTLARDPMGVRPMYWARSGHRFAFASELPALLEVPWVSREPAREHLAEYLSFRVVHAPRTLLEDVHQVEPGHWLRVHADALATRPYWRPRYAPEGTPRPRESEVIPALQEAVRQGVRRRLAGDAPTALYLSGGLGSTAIAAALKSLDRSIPSFTIGFDDDLNPETPFAGRVARLLGQQHHDVAVGSRELAESFEATVRALGHPIGNPATILQLRLARAASSQARVVFSGEGAEELFGGPMLDRLDAWLAMARRVARLPAPARALLTGVAQRTGRGRRMVASPDRYGLQLELGGSDVFSTSLRAGVLREPDLVRPNVRTEVLAPFYADLDTDPINATLHAFLRSWLGEESLIRADRTAAASGLSIYFPLLDRDVLALAMSLPGSFKLRRVGGASVHTRWPLQAMLSGVVPQVLVNRPKRGMPTPLDAWLAGPGRLFLEERYSLLREDPLGLWQPEGLEALRRSMGRAPNAGIQLWSLFILDAWLRGLAR
jgi:asparagine synthase (glutamine-hydrolysing)